jgi:hypothetical protein
LNRGRHRGEAFRSLTGCDHRHPAAHKNFSASIYETSGNLRSSDIYSDDELGCRFHCFQDPSLQEWPSASILPNPWACELYMPAKKIASSPNRIGLLWQQSPASSHYTFHLRGPSASFSQMLLLVPIVLQFLAFAGPPIASMTIGGIALF